MIMCILYRFYPYGILAILITSAHAEPDVEYGQYLSSVCVTCHQPNSANSTIPNIEGLEASTLVQILKLYRSQQLPNEAMQTVTKRLTNEELEALGAYFSSRPSPE